MSKGQNQKLKLLRLARIFTEKTDEAHPLEIRQIQELLAEEEIHADRKTLYADFEDLRRCGFDIVGQHIGKKVSYHLASRVFELAEVKLLVDSVQAAKFVTEKKSAALIRKLASLASEHEAKQLQRHVLIAGRVKTGNESILINVDRIHAAIHADKMISFRYFQWTPDKKRELRHDARVYRCSPWHLVWDDENYYLIGYDSREEGIKHYRVDKMLEIEETGESREGRKRLADLDIAVYSKRLFGMRGGEVKTVTLECRNEMAGVIMDRFGAETPILRCGKTHFRADVELIPGEPFFGWVIGLGGAVKLLAPEEVVQDLKSLLEKQRALYF